MPTAPWYTERGVFALLAFHLLGVAIWLGGSLTLIWWTATSKHRGPAMVAYVYPLVDRINRVFITPAWIVVLATGLAMMGLGQRSMAVNVMAGLGILAMIIFIILVVPTNAQLARAAEDCGRRGELTEEFRHLDRRAALWASVAGVLVLVALFVGTYATAPFSATVP